MIDADAFIDGTAQIGINFFSGVPCSFLTPLLNSVISRPGTAYCGATSEGEAMAIAAGAWLAGRETAVMCQNSGLGNTINPVTSLNYSFRIPTLMIVTWRGQPGIGDEPQHELMGEITQDMLGLCRVNNAPFPTAPDQIAPTLHAARAHMDAEELPYALVLPKGGVAKSPLTQTPVDRRARPVITGDFTSATPPRRIDAMERIKAALPDAGFIATTGFCGRELYALSDDPGNLYVVGSMGGASAMGLGAALNTRKQIVVLDGDGAALMKLGNLATIGGEAPENLTHILLDNGLHESTGGQQTVSPNVDFAEIARACGYRAVARADRLADLDASLSVLMAQPGPRLLHLRVSPSQVEGLPRPTVGPPEVARRFRTFLSMT
ncbi:phosphonopyruvate decarboxylase [Salinihabitans flavidus]|nr:phosphonopyruvate decarboxylase [Salinihabitans flavidus]